jgi:hypothetical protein
MIKVIDNVISEKYSQFIFEQCTSLPWTFVPNISVGRSDDYSSSGFSYTFLFDKKYKYNSEDTTRTSEFNYIIPLLLEASDKFQLDGGLDRIFRCRARLTLNREVSKIEEKHVDFKIPHFVILYYINNTDGDTYLFDGDKVIEKITPRRGRCVLFDGSILHSSSSSTLSPRIVLNTNLTL